MPCPPTRTCNHKLATASIPHAPHACSMPSNASKWRAGEHDIRRGFLIYNYRIKSLESSPFSSNQSFLYPIGRNPSCALTMHTMQNTAAPFLTSDIIAALGLTLNLFLSSQDPAKTERFEASYRSDFSS